MKDINKRECEMAKMKKLYIPESIKRKSEIFNDFGLSQLMQTAVITGIAGVISYFIYLAHGSLSILITNSSRAMLAVIG